MKGPRIYIIILLILIISVIIVSSKKHSKKKGSKESAEKGKSLGGRHKGKWEKRGKHSEEEQPGEESGGKWKKRGKHSEEEQPGEESGGKWKKRGKHSEEDQADEKSAGRSGGKSKKRGKHSEEDQADEKSGGRSGGKSKKRGKHSEEDQADEKSGGRSGGKSKKRGKHALEEHSDEKSGGRSGGKSKKRGKHSEEDQSDEKSGGRSGGKSKKRGKHSSEEQPGAKYGGRSGKPSKDKYGGKSEKRGKRHSSEEKSGKKSGGRSKRVKRQSSESDERGQPSNILAGIKSIPKIKEEQLAQRKTGTGVIVCEHKKQPIACQTNKVIKINYANYGRSDRTTCGRSNVQDCKSTTSAKLIRQQCDGKSSCNLLASNGIYGDPCRGNKKYLEVYYECQPGKTKPEVSKVLSVKKADDPVKPVKPEVKKVVPVKKAEDSDYIGCFIDKKDRFLNSRPNIDRSLTIERCAKYCSKKGYAYAGLEYKVQCFCGHKLGTYKKVSDKQCNMACAGDGSEKCGGSWRISVYKSGKETTKVKEVKAAEESDYVGCFMDRRVRFFGNSKKHVDKRLTVEKCVSLCSGMGYNYAGLEYRHECFCGHKLGKYGRVSEQECNTPCAGDKTQKCGGSWRLSVYKSDGVCGGKKCHSKARCKNGKCVCNRGFYGDGFNSCEKTCHCMASGDPHYKTYDGQMIHFMGVCKYTLTKSSNETDKCAFNVEVKNEHRRRNTKVAYTRLVDVTIYGKTIRLSQKKVVYIDRQRKYLPANELDGKLKVFNSGRFVQVWSECGIQVNFDGEHAVSVVVPGRFENKMIGLCGDCNGKMDDFKTKDGADVRNSRDKYSAVGNSYVVVDDSDKPGKTCKTENITVECDDEVGGLARGPLFCGRLKDRQGPFAECIQAFPDLANDFYGSCLFDVCSFADDREFLATAKCNAIEAFAEECAEKGINMKWRTATFCPIECEDPNMEYSVEGTGCPASCLEPDAPNKCTFESREGCFCKKGFVQSDNRCVPVQDCGCKDKYGDYYPIGVRKESINCEVEYVCQAGNGRTAASFRQVGNRKKCHADAMCDFDENGQKRCICKKGFVGDGYECIEEPIEDDEEESVEEFFSQELQFSDNPCERCHKNARCRNRKCVCKRGYYGDGINHCEKSCHCLASGDPHYKTFDGQMIHFMGACKYTFTRSVGSTDECAFNVEVKNNRRGKNQKVSYTREVDIEIYGLKISLLKKLVVLINGERKYLPVSQFNGNLNIFHSGKFVQVVTKCGVNVNYDGKHAVSVVVPGNYSSHVTGLCGDCNGKRDDFRTSNGTDVSLSKDKYSQIGNSYLVKDDSYDAKIRCNCTDIELHCNKEMQAQVGTAKFCGELKNTNGIFTECIKRIPEVAAQFFSACVFDVCSYEGDKQYLQTAKCNAIEGFAEECAENGMPIRWRREGFCKLKCEDPNMVYRSDGTGCPSTCIDRDTPKKCALEPREGCFCKRGFVLSDGKCVEESQCGCLDENSNYYPIGTKKVSENCSYEYICQRVENQSVFVKDPSSKLCHADARCRLDKNGDRRCVCKVGYAGDGYAVCIKVTRNDPGIAELPADDIDITTTRREVPKPVTGITESTINVTINGQETKEPPIEVSRNDPEITPSDDIEETTEPPLDDMGITTEPSPYDISITTEPMSDVIDITTEPASGDIDTTTESILGDIDITTEPTSDDIDTTTESILGDINIATESLSDNTDTTTTTWLPFTEMAQDQPVSTAKPTTKPAVKPPIRTYVKPKPKKQPKLGCDVDVNHQSCGTSIRLSGICQYSSKFSSRCDFSAKTTRMGEVSYVRINGRLNILKEGTTVKECAVFKQSGGVLTITDYVCESCSLDIIRSLTSNSVCTAP